MALKSMLPLMLGYRSLIWIIKQYQQATRSPKLDINPPLLIVAQNGGGGTQPGPANPSLLAFRPQHTASLSPSGSRRAISSFNLISALNRSILGSRKESR